MINSVCKSKYLSSYSMKNQRTSPDKLNPCVMCVTRNVMTDWKTNLCFRLSTKIFYLKVH